MTLLRLGTYNCANGMKDIVFRDDLDRLLPQVDVIGFQEFHSSGDRNNLADMAKKHGFTVCRGKDPGIPITFRTDAFTLLDQGNVFLSAPFKSKRGAGPSVLGAKDLFWIKLRHKATRRTMYFANVHLAPSIQFPERFALHSQQTDNIVKWIKTRGYNLFLLGDFNIDLNDDLRDRNPKMPLIKFTRIGVRSVYRILGKPKLSSFKGRTIDYIFFRVNKKRLRPVSQKMLTGYSSDHRPYIVTFEIYPRIKR